MREGIEQDEKKVEKKILRAKSRPKKQWRNKKMLSKGKVEKKRSRLESGVEIAVGFSGCPQTLSKIYGSLLSMEVWNNKHFHRSLTPLGRRSWDLPPDREVATYIIHVLSIRLGGCKTF
jgi:hypothetical protein